MSFASVCAFLAGEPYHLRPWEVAKLTPRQVRTIYLHERDKQGRLAVDTGQRQASYQEIFYHVWRQRAFPEHVIDAKWRKYQEEQKPEKESRKR